MSYHDYRNYTTKWPATRKQEAKDDPNPKLQIISPQKKLFDIQQVIKSLPEQAMTIVELSEAIQKILDGE